MRIAYLFFVLTLIFTAPVARMYAGLRDVAVGVSIHSGIGVVLAEEDGSLDFPVYGDLYGEYSKANFKIHGGIGYYDEIIPQEVYIEADNSRAMLRAGRFSEYWGIGLGYDPLPAFTGRNAYFPDNIFYMRMFIPSYAFLFEMEMGDVSNEIILADRESNTYSDEVDDGLGTRVFGYRVITEGDIYRIAIGALKGLRRTPVQFFTQVSGYIGGIYQYLEVNWLYDRGSSRWTGLFGLSRKIYNSKAALELVFDGEKSLFHMVGDIYPVKNLELELDSYVDIKDLSSCWKAGANFYANDSLYLAVSGIMFLGKKNKTFSQSSADSENNSAVYVTLNFENR